MLFPARVSAGVTLLCTVTRDVFSINVSLRFSWIGRTKNALVGLSYRRLCTLRLCLGASRDARLRVSTQSPESEPEVPKKRPSPPSDRARQRAAQQTTLYDRDPHPAYWDSSLGVDGCRLVINRRTLARRALATRSSLLERLQNGSGAASRWAFAIGVHRLALVLFWGESKLTTACVPAPPGDSDLSDAVRRRFGHYAAR